jgi:hypothetical protein
MNMIYYDELMMLVSIMLLISVINIENVENSSVGHHDTLKMHTFC